MKAFKKSDTFGEKDQWQISATDRREVELELREYSDFYTQDEVIDDMIVVLHKLGYVKIEGENE